MVNPIIYGQKGSIQFSPTQFLLFKHRQAITFMFKVFLNELEDMVDNNLISEDYYKKKRKFILDEGNTMIRSFEELLNNYNIKDKKYEKTNQYSFNN